MKYIKRICLGLIGLYLLALGLDVFISRLYMNSNLNDGEFQISKKVIYDLDRYDLDILGTSRAMVHFNTKILDSSLKIKSFNYGYNGKKFFLQNLRFEMLNDKNRVSKNLILALDSFTLEKIENYKIKQSIPDLNPHLLYNYKLYNRLKNNYELNSLEFFIPLYRYLSIDTVRFLKKWIFYKNRLTENVRKKGFIARNSEWVDASFDTDSTYYVQDTLLKKDFERFIKLRKSEGINILLIYTPIYKQGRDLESNRDSIIKYYQKIAEQYNIPFLDYSYDSISDQKNLFYNSLHLNAKGADVFTKKLAEDIRPYIKY